MDKYISKDDVRRVISKAFTDKRFATVYDYAILVDEIDDIPNADLESKDKWISVKDKLPDEMQDKSIYSGWSEERRPSDNVLILTKRGAYDVAWYSYVFHDWTSANETTNYAESEVDCWQPLPELPKEEKMTLDEMISDCLKVAEDQCKVAAEFWDHRQLAEWLKELKENRKLLEALKVNKYITKKDAINALLEKGQHSNRYKLGETWELNLLEIQEAIDKLPAKLIKKVGEE